MFKSTLIHTEIFAIYILDSPLISESLRQVYVYFYIQVTLQKHIIHIHQFCEATRVKTTLKVTILTRLKVFT